MSAKDMDHAMDCWSWNADSESILNPDGDEVLCQGEWKKDIHRFCCSWKLSVTGEARRGVCLSSTYRERVLELSIHPSACSCLT